MFTSVEQFKKTFKNRLRKTFFKNIKDSTIRERYHVLGMLVKEELAEAWIDSKLAIEKNEAKQVHYFSMEFLLGRLITNNLISLGIRDITKDGFDELGFDLNEVENYESDPGLGNGGLGRLAACFLDSLAALKYPGSGNCIRYRYGLFKQTIKNGYQEERPDNWLSDGYVWEVRKTEEAESIPFYGEVSYKNNKMTYIPDEYIRAVPYDIPIIGDNNEFVNKLRIWNAEPDKRYPENKSPFEYESELEQISGFLYPDDSNPEGKTLRLKQQYFLSAAGLKSIIRKHKEKYGTLKNFAAKNVIHINDTHPALLIPELIRILIDEEKFSWDKAWEITSTTFAYTNHTILAEALEKWSIDIIKPLLPRIFQIVEEIDRRFVEKLARENKGVDLINKLRVINHNQVRMAHLCIISSYSVNGVAKLHTNILKNIEMKDFNELYPEKFVNITNGITHRRWLLHSNPELTSFIEKRIGEGFKTNPSELNKLLEYKDDKNSQLEFLKIKKIKKQALANRIYQEQKLEINTDSIFDIQVKRLHEYKRQLMNALHILYVYNQLKTSSEFKNNYYPHTYIFGAKAAGSYHFAKKIIKLINTIAKKVNNDPDTNEYLKVVFVENYNVSYAEMIMPACDISEQISTASKEASGTGNMKFMMNGAITLGTLDGANVEINELVSKEAIYIFGLSADEVNDLTVKQNYNPRTLYETDPIIKKLLDQLVNGYFKSVERNEFREIFDNLVYKDQYFVLKDFHEYRLANEAINKAYKNQYDWAKIAIENIAKSGVFSSDRSIKDYARKIWNIKKIK
ncbi:MAG: glycogen/starch/alpha-glucan phosphorylase [Candidatus Izimaplasma sp.]|nr:glycogen/starch/alpha-glucan phosphorylase [Candidatus Izimaplasma bacterium]